MTHPVAEDAMRELAGLRIDPTAPAGSSDLSVGELLLVREAGFRPLALVSGCSVVHVAWQRRRYSQSHELTEITRALTRARDTAMRQVQEQAAAVGAHGVVGMRLTVGSTAWGSRATEFVAVGTAVRARAATPAPGDGWLVRGLPFTCALAGGDLWTLLRAGYAPAGFVLGSCVMAVARRGPVATAAAWRHNLELTAYTDALYDARELALTRMQAEAQALAADGVVGVDLALGGHRSGPHTEEFLATGTAIRPLARQPAHPTSAMSLALDS